MHEDTHTAERHGFIATLIAGLGGCSAPTPALPFHCPGFYVPVTVRATPKKPKTNT